MEQQLKQKIVNTISHYEEQCNKLQGEVNLLRKAIDKLTTLPSGIHIDLDKHVLDLKDALKKNKDPVSIQHRVASLVDVMSHLQQKRQENKIIITDFIKQGADLLGQMLIELKDKHAFERMEQLLKTDTDERKLIREFNQLLKECVNTVAQQIEFCEQHHSLELGLPKINTQINSQFLQIMEHLPIPDDLLKQQEAIKTTLNEDLTEEKLLKVAENLTELVVKSFNFEQNRFKGILYELSAHLRDFGKYLQLSIEDNTLTRESTEQLETDVRSSIQDIKNHIDNSQSFEELSKKIETSLAAIGSHIKTFKEYQEGRLADYENKMLVLQDKLMETERGAKEIKNMLSFERLKNNQDSLTGLPNRASYEEHMLDAYHRWQRGFGDLSIAIADIDNFKHINDTYGHLAGDKVLKKIAALFKSSIRAMDFIGRYGGEEFIFIFERTHLNNAAKVAEELRSLIEEYDFYYREKRVCVTVSFGLTNFQHGDDLETLFTRADEAMYEAKHQGKNRVVAL
ncbi:GGDEF domain-containing protein [Legionella jamestowniensis]|nr:GGDEF domain-containing protein [Legionella jamestowniensis]KTD06832.1 GGDEF domain-containing protein [Legionella jamestowniensis]SFL82543.1 diguanylate cyclase (GGDEF) domain-containing protein [Legionella jamestowniensis DSM 19215]